MDQVFFFLTDWATPRRQSHTSHGAAGAAGGMQHRSALVARQVNALWLLSIDSGQLQQFAWQLPCRTVGHSQWVWQTSTYRAGIPSTPLESSLRMQRTNWQLWPRVGWVGRATSGRQAGRQTVRQIVLPLLIGNFWHAQQRFLYRFMMTTDRQTEAEGELQRGTERG